MRAGGGRKPALIKGFSIERMVKMRVLRGWSQADLAWELGVVQATVAQWERGRSYPQTDRQILITAILFADEVAELWTLPDRLEAIEKRLTKLEKRK